MRYESIGDCGEGTYSLSVEAADFEVFRQEGIRLDRPGRELEIVLRRGLRLEGRVLSSASGKAVPGATIVFRQSEEDLRVVQANELGEYRVSGLAAGDGWDLTVYADGYSTIYVEDFEIKASPEHQTFDFHLDPAAVLAGRVVDASDAPVSRARVRFERPRGSRTGLPETLRERRRREAEHVKATTDGTGLFVHHGAGRLGHR